MKNNRQLIDMFCQNCVTEASKKANAPIFFCLEETANRMFVQGSSQIDETVQ